MDYIQNKLEFASTTLFFSFYHGNHCLEFTVSLLTFVFLFLPMFMIGTFFGFVAQNHRVIDNCFIRKLTFVMSVTHFIAYEFFFQFIF